MPHDITNALFPSEARRCRQIRKIYEAVEQIAQPQQTESLLDFSPAVREWLIEQDYTFE
ncbi:MAG: hypothetical protein WBF58_03080 [Xanthobacteraceae bacterium]